MEYILLLWALYIAFILLAPLMMLNCLNAIFVEGVITKITHKKLEKVKEDLNKKQDVARRLKKIFTELDISGDGFVTEIEIKGAMENSAVLSEVKRLGLRAHHLEAMFITADDNGTGRLTSRSLCADSRTSSTSRSLARTSSRWRRSPRCRPTRSPIGS